LTLKEGQKRPAADEWGTISAWAWSVSRCIDFFESDRAFDAKRVAITGASRLGKTVLWAGAQDERVAAVFSVVPGELGASLIRRDWGETVDDMARTSPGSSPVTSRSGSVSGTICPWTSTCSSPCAPRGRCTSTAG